MNYIFILPVIGLALAPAALHADEPTQCADNAGTFLTGTVISGPVFKRGHFLHDIELSHTHVTLQSDQDGQRYDVAIDNVFAAGYDNAGESIPSPLTSITIGTHLELCGKPYPEGGGIDWVHTDCGDTPTPRSPEGWLKIIDPAGGPGPNLEASEEYCKIFRHGILNASSSTRSMPRRPDPSAAFWDGKLTGFGLRDDPSGSAAPVGDEEGVEQVVAPDFPHAQVVAQQAFAAEPEFLDQRNRRAVVGMNEGLSAMQA